MESEKNKKTEQKESRLKGRLTAVQPKKLFPAFAVIGAVLLILRIYQTQSLMDPLNGFFKDSDNFTILPFYILSVGFAVAAFLLFYLGRQLPVDKLPVQRNVPHAVACLLFAGTLIYEGIQQLKGYNMSAQAALGSETGAAALNVLRLYLVFSFLSAVVMLLDAVVFFTGAAFGEKMRIVRLFPVFWGFFLTVSFFNVTASYIHSTQLFLTIFSSAFFMLYLFEYARKIAGVMAEENTAVFCATGVVSAVLLLTVGITDLLLVVNPKTGAMPHCEFTPYSIAGGIFCITSLFLLKGASADAQTAAVPTVPLSPAQTDAPAVPLTPAEMPVSTAEE